MSTINRKYFSSLSQDVMSCFISFRWSMNEKLKNKEASAGKKHYVKR